MSALIDRLRVITQSYTDRLRRGLPVAEGPLDRDVIFILDGVGGFQFAPVMIRRAIRVENLSIGTIVVKWQFGLVGEIWTDLMWLRRNRVVAARIARRILTFRRDHPTTRMHLLGYSGGAGVSVLACEALRGRRVLETLILMAPALSPEYNLAPALRAANRCAVLISERDKMLLGLGTRLFGTIDRRRTDAAGQVGFQAPPGLSSDEQSAYDRVSQISWTPAFRQWGVSGGHIGWLSERFLAHAILPLVASAPDDYQSQVESIRAVRTPNDHL